MVLDSKAEPDGDGRPWQNLRAKATLARLYTPRIYQSIEQNAELSAVEQPEVDLRALQAEVRAAAGAARGGNVPEPTMEAQPARASREPRRHPLHRTAEIRPYEPLAAGPVQALKRAIRRALRWYLWPVTTHMSLHNRAVADAVAENRRQLTRLRLELERLDHDTGGPDR